MNKQEYKNKIALITGGAVRIGAILAKYLSEKNYDVYITSYFSIYQANILKKNNIIKDYFKIDLLNPKEISDLLDNFSRIDLVINNAAIFERDSNKNFSYQNLEKSIKFNSIAPAFIAHEIYKRNFQSHIINISDSSSKIIHEDFFSYHTSKFLLEELSKSQARSYYPKVRINVIAIKALIPHYRQSNEHFQALSYSEDTNKNIKQLLSDIDYLEQIKETGIVIKY